MTVGNLWSMTKFMLLLLIWLQGERHKGVRRSIIYNKIIKV
jgi:hypothetical protein